MAKKDEIIDFLMKLKSAIADGKQFLLKHDRRENKITMEDLEYKKADVKNEILTLSVGNFMDGPMDDDQGRPGKIWEFGKVIKGRDIYIKFSITTRPNGEFFYCISFHFASHPLRFPYPGG